MRARIAITFAVLCAAVMILTIPAVAQEAEGHRRVLNKMAPHYPELARSMNLEGTVNVTVTVSPNGSVKSIHAVGGNPVLLKAAEDAIYHWRWAPAALESQELVQLRFHPN